MKILVAITSCAKYEANHQSMRDTWLPEAVNQGMDYKFFLEKDASVRDDVILCRSETWDMTGRLKEKIHYTLEHEYDYVFICFPDTYVVPSRLLASKFSEFDYFGSVHKAPSVGATFYCHGGAGYFLSRKACAVVDTNATGYLNDDTWLGDVLNGADIRMGHSEDFRHHAGSPLKENSVITSHLSDASHHVGVEDFHYTPQYMYDEHQKWLQSEGDDMFLPTVSEVCERVSEVKPRMLFPDVPKIKVVKSLIGLSPYRPLS